MSTSCAMFQSDQGKVIEIWHCFRANCLMCGEHITVHRHITCLADKWHEGPMQIGSSVWRDPVLVLRSLQCITVSCNQFKGHYHGVWNLLNSPHLPSPFWLMTYRLVHCMWCELLWTFLWAYNQLPTWRPFSESSFFFFFKEREGNPLPFLLL